MSLHTYVNKIKKLYKSGISTEHSYRGDLQVLLTDMVPGIIVTNEPKRQECGAPDYIIQRKQVPLGYIEAKDIGIDLNKIEKSEQLKRYLKSLDNLILTDYLDFRFFRYGEKVGEIHLGEVVDGKISVFYNNFASFETHIKDFCNFQGQTIKSSSKLAKIMAHKAKLMEEILHNVVTEEGDNSLKDQLKAFRRILIHDLKEESFADIYAQTIAYGMFAARLHDTTLEDFSRQEARDLIPKSNPFLRNLFDYISGANLDDRIVWIVDELANIFQATDLKELLKDFGKQTGQYDPFLHFYETFLAEYNPKLRKSRGVYYTPEPVVDFIVRAVDDILVSEFGIKKGLADTSKVTIKYDSDVTDKRTKSKKMQIEKEVHKVQILDPAAGTGTFLANVVKHIYKKFEGQEGIWSNYVEEHLIPRLNGFEILMAPYAMCHLKLEMLLTETGYKPSTKGSEKRLRVFLTNSLEKAHPDTGTLFASWLSKESEDANFVKQNTPVMVILGNPPYSGESSNKGQWIMDLMEDYKKEPGGQEKLKEKNSKWINDDYVKFLRYGQHFIEKNGSGILAFINPHGFLDNPTFRGMRWHLLKTYDKIYSLNLHGNAKKKEKCPDGSYDENVFDIQQGVSINLFVKTGKKKSSDLAEVYYSDLYGLRDYKYNFLIENSKNSVDYKKLLNKPKMYFMVPRDYETQESYTKGFLINELFVNNNVGIVTSRDSFIISEDEKTLVKRIKDFINLDRNEILQKYKISENKRWKINEVKSMINDIDMNNIVNIMYRPFDIKKIYYNDYFVERTRRDIMYHMVAGENLGVVYKLGNSEEKSASAMVSRNIIDFRSWSRPGMQGGDSIAPLYLYHENPEQLTISGEYGRKPNLDMDIIQKIANGLKLTFTNEKEDTVGTFAPIDILDYIYAMLHSPSYREKYKEFLKIDFPRVPYPKDKKTFWKLGEKGGELRQIHLLESPKVEQYITKYPVGGDNIITRKLTTKSPGFEFTDEKKGIGRVWVNDEQYFDDVPLIAWEFYIGGYQPAQKWLKDRRGRALTSDDIFHYQKIIVALTQTHRIMGEIDKIDRI
ncbi:N-6 DNA methylase [bacterium]|nr:N-6 DNA methylase [bacterium]